MTYKSFSTTNELFDLLAARFWIQPPENITPAELEEWKRLKQHVVRARLVLP
jgi:son of sevenless